MYKVMLVDDDSFARSNLKNLFNWEKHNYIICGEASNGAKAMQIIKQENPDIIITDISMPVMDGIGLIEKVTKQYPRIKIIALSGYDDFDYVRKSLTLGAVDYLLKYNLTQEELLRVLQWAVSRIQNEDYQQAEKKQQEKEIYLGRLLLRREFLKQWVKGYINDLEEIQNRIQTFALPLKPQNIVVMLIEIDDFNLLELKYCEQELEHLRQSCLDLAVEILKDYQENAIFHEENGRFVIILSFGTIRSQFEISTQINSCIERIRNSIKRYLNITASYSVSKARTGFATVSSSYHEAEEFLKNKFHQGKDQIFFESGQIFRETNRFSLDLNLEKQLMDEFKFGNEETVAGVIREIFLQLAQRKVSYQMSQMICIELIHIASRVAQEIGMDGEEFSVIIEAVYEKLPKLEILDDLAGEMNEVFLKLMQLRCTVQVNQDYSQYTQKAIQFIYKNYNRNISLEDAAMFVGVSGPYLSRVFKEECDKGFVEYLNIFRVERAKDLIRNEAGKKLKEIVKTAGFNNYNYFFKVFKDLTGMTPLEYEHLCKKEIRKHDGIDESINNL